MKKLTKITALTLIMAASGVAATAAYADRDRFESKSSHCAHSEHKGSSGKMHHHRAEKDLNLSADQAKTLVEARLIMRGNERLKAGKVSKKDDKTYLVQVVTVDDSLVREVEVNRQHGVGKRGQHRM